MKKNILIFVLCAFVPCIYAQTSTIPVDDNLVVEGIPPLPSAIVDDVKNYTEARSASLVAWHPNQRNMLISTRFANSNQLHYVKFPGGDRKQITFFDEPIASASFEPRQGDYFLFLKDRGGDEFHQIFRYDLADNKITMVTDGAKSQNVSIVWSEQGDRIAYTSTKRNGKDRDVYIVDPLNPGSKKMVSENSGGRWSVVDWSIDDSKLLLQEDISINETRLFMLDLKSGNKTRILPEHDERSTYVGIAFSKDGKGIYLITNIGNEFNRLAFFDFHSKKTDIITSAIPWDVTSAELSKDKTQLAFVTNEDGLSRAYVLNTSSNKFSLIPGFPTGVIGSISWSGDSKSLGFSLDGYNASSDIFEYNGKEIIRWTESELGGMDLRNLKPPELINWRTFDGKTLSGYLYRPPADFKGKRPVMITIHGGPESQARPIFQHRMNYYLKELGIAILYPNVRGSAGYGKTFVDLDNGVKRVESVKDIGALIDWIATQPELDDQRIMVVGGSYGGYMTLAVSYLYSDKIRCSVDVVGISNFNTFLKNTEAYRRDLRRVEYGDERDPEMAAFFETIAPINHTDKIKKPLFIIQGGNDPRVPYTESIQMKEKIKQNGGNVWFLMARDEGHGFRKKNNIDFQFYSTIAFIKEFLLK